MNRIHQLALVVLSLALFSLGAHAAPKVRDLKVSFKQGEPPVSTEEQTSYNILADIETIGNVTEITNIQKWDISDERGYYLVSVTFKGVFKVGRSDHFYADLAGTYKTAVFIARRGGEVIARSMLSMPEFSRVVGIAPEIVKFSKNRPPAITAALFITQAIPSPRGESEVIRYSFDFETTPQAQTLASGKLSVRSFLFDKATNNSYLGISFNDTLVVNGQNARSTKARTDAAVVLVSASGKAPHLLQYDRRNMAEVSFVGLKRADKEHLALAVSTRFKDKIEKPVELGVTIVNEGTGAAHTSLYFPRNARVSPEFLGFSPEGLVAHVKDGGQVRVLGNHASNVGQTSFLKLKQNGYLLIIPDDQTSRIQELRQWFTGVQTYSGIDFMSAATAGAITSDELLAFLTKYAAFPEALSNNSSVLAQAELDDFTEGESSSGETTTIPTQTTSGEPGEPSGPEEKFCGISYFTNTRTCNSTNFGDPCTNVEECPEPPERTCSTVSGVPSCNPDYFGSGGKSCIDDTDCVEGGIFRYCSGSLCTALGTGDYCNDSSECETDEPGCAYVIGESGPAGYYACIAGGGGGSCSSDSDCIELSNLKRCTWPYGPYNQGVCAPSAGGSGRLCLNAQGCTGSIQPPINPSPYINQVLREDCFWRRIRVEYQEPYSGGFPQPGQVGGSLTIWYEHRSGGANVPTLTGTIFRALGISEYGFPEILGLTGENGVSMGFGRVFDTDDPSEEWKIDWIFVCHRF